MSHLSHDQLSAHADGALTGHELERATRHLDACAECRAELARIAADTAALGRTLSHDPGEVYFADFADRVARRIATTPAPVPALEPRRRSWWTPAHLAWAGGLATIAAGAAIVVVVARQPQLDLRERMSAREQSARGPASTREQARAEAPSAGSTRAGDPATPGEPRSRLAMEHSAPTGQEAPQSAMLPAPSPVAPGTPVPAEKSAFAKPAPAAPAPVSPARAHEVRSTPAGEDLPVDRALPPVLTQRQALTPPPAPAPANEPAIPLQSMKSRPAQPLSDARSDATPERVTLATQVDRGLLCGSVTDDKGRAIPGAQVALADLGVSVSTDRTGHFCVTTPPGSRTLAVMAVGFETIRRTVEVGEQTPEIALELRPVPVLSAPLAIGDVTRMLRAEGGAPSSSGVTTLAPKAEISPLTLKGPATAPREADLAAPDEALAPFAQQPDSVRALARGAQRLVQQATRTRSAGFYDAAAGEWERVLRHAATGPAEIEARQRLAESRFRAWETSPSPRRARLAVEALTRYLLRAPAGRARDTATVWLDRIPKR